MFGNRILLQILPIMVVLFMGFGCNGSSTTDRNSTPTKAVETLFEVAKSGNFKLLKDICDPRVRHDGDVECLCALSDEFAPEACASDEITREEYVKYFKKGKVFGEPVIEDDEAEVDFYFGPDGTDTETMRLIQHDGKWYLSNF